jgi:hypothetical protein
MRTDVRIRGLLAVRVLQVCKRWFKEFQYLGPYINNNNNQKLRAYLKNTIRLVANKVKCFNLRLSELVRLRYNWMVGLNRANIK